MSLDAELMAPRDRRLAERLEEAEKRSGPSGAASFKAIKSPVGIRNGTKQVTNRVADQRAVMAMLDKLSIEYGGNRKTDGTFDVVWPAPIEGKCDLALFTVILRVQTKFYTLGILGFHPDGVIDPGGKTEQLIKDYSGDEPPFPADNPKEIAKAAVPLALHWAKGASAYLLRYKVWRMAECRYPFDAKAANVHLHLDELNRSYSLVACDDWMAIYSKIIAALQNAEHVFIRASREESLAARNRMKCWGNMVPAWATANVNIWFGPDMLGLGPKCKSAILLHECGHYVSSEIGHQGGERGSEYDNQGPWLAQTSAYVCANFATHATTGRDERYGLARMHE